MSKQAELFVFLRKKNGISRTERTFDWALQKMLLVRTHACIGSDVYLMSGRAEQKQDERVVHYPADSVSKNCRNLTKLEMKT